MPSTQPPKDVFAIVEKGGNQRAIWIRVGAAFVNQDGSLNIKLDAVPLTGTLQVRERRADQQRQPDREPRGGYRDEPYHGNNGVQRNGGYPI